MTARELICEALKMLEPMTANETAIAVERVNSLLAEWTPLPSERDREITELERMFNLPAASQD